MRARLECKLGTLRGQRFELEAEATLGRGIDNTIVLDDEQISTQHARIWFDEARGCYLLEDLGSLNGTEVDGVKVIHPEALPGLHVVTFAGELDFVFQRLPDPEAVAADPETDDDAAEPTAEDAGSGPAAQPAPGATAAAEPPGGPVLEVTLPGGAPASFPLREGEHVIGRDDQAGIRLEADQISRRHARLTVRGGRVLLADLGSSNHTFVDDNPIQDEVELVPGARIRFGNLEARLLAGIR